MPLNDTIQRPHLTPHPGGFSEISGKSAVLPYFKPALLRSQNKNLSSNLVGSARIFSLYLPSACCSSPGLCLKPCLFFTVCIHSRPAVSHLHFSDCILSLFESVIVHLDSLLSPVSTLTQSCHLLLLAVSRAMCFEFSFSPLPLLFSLHRPSSSLS